VPSKRELLALHHAATCLKTSNSIVRTSDLTHRELVGFWPLHALSHYRLITPAIQRWTQSIYKQLTQPKNPPLFLKSQSRSTKISRPAVAIKYHVFVLRHLALASHDAWALTLFLHESLPHHSHIAYISNEPPRNFRRMPGSHQTTISSSHLMLRPQWRRQGALGPWNFYFRFVYFSLFNIDGSGGAQSLGDWPWPPSGERGYLI
jgi:hypothetical protein